jgi:hypothetical protein
MKLFWDIDETLIHTKLNPFRPEWDCDLFEIDGYVHYTRIRPCARDLIEYSRSLFGDDNVYILTAATHQYAREINRLADWGFTSEQIFAREIMEQYTLRSSGGWGAERVQVKPHALAHPDNILIDNLPPEWNEEKTSFMLINPKTNYLKVEDYVGDNTDEDIFRDTVKHFLAQKRK